MKKKVFAFSVLLALAVTVYMAGCAGTTTTATSFTTTTETVQTLVTSMATSTLTETATTTTTLPATTTTVTTFTTITPTHSTTITPTTTPPVTTPVTAPPTTSEVTPVISIAGGSFSPSQLTIKAGSVVEFDNIDHVDYTIISDYPFSELIGSEQSFEMIFDKVGTFHFWSESSPNNKGTIIVTA